MRRTMLATCLGVGLLAISIDAVAQDSPFPDRTRQAQSTSNAIPSRPLPARPDSPSANAADERSSRSSGSSWGTLIALTVVIGLILVTGKFWRRFSPSASQSLPSQAVNILGRKSLDSRHSLTLLKCGSRILVLGFSPHGMHTLTEISDAAEVDVLAGLCSTISPETHTTAGFRDVWKRTSEVDQSTPQPDHQEASLMERYANTHA